VGAILVPLAAALCAGALAFARLPHSLALSLAAALAFAALQTWSHALEPVPPPLSGADGFLPVGEWWLRAGLRRKLATALLSATSFVLLELIASPKILPCQVRSHLFALGFLPGERAAIERGVRALEADWAARA